MDAGLIGSFSAFLPSGYLSPIRKFIYIYTFDICVRIFLEQKSSVIFSDSMESESITDASTSYSNSSFSSEIFEKNIPQISNSPIKTAPATIPQKMTTLPEETEPLTSTYGEPVDLSKREYNRATTDVGVSNMMETTDTPLMTPKKKYNDQDFE